MIKVNLENQNKKRKINLSLVEKIAKKVLQELKKDDSEINIIFISNQKIRVLNRKYFNRDNATDVIAFPSGEEIHETRFLGDIAISTDKAKQNAIIFKVSFFEEVTLYVIHGILHLLGYKDTTGKNRKIMRKKEDELKQRIKNFS